MAFRIRPLAGLLALAALPSPVLAQGTFPPAAGPTTPVMKTLQQIEPRVDLLKSVGSNGVTSSASFDYIISSPGSYYLSDNLGATKTNAIQINSSGVTLDLNGFEITRASGSGGDGIQGASGIDQITIAHGTIRNFTNGVTLNANSRACSLRQLQARQDTGIGLNGGEATLLEDCTAVSCGIGIQTQNHSILSRCTADACTGNYGIYAGQNSTLTSCTATNGTSGYGICGDNGCSLTGCTASKNAGARALIGLTGATMTNCSANSNTSVYGIEIGSGGTLTNCTANNNTNTATSSGGILAGVNSTVTGCTANSNSSTAASLNGNTGVGISAGSSSTLTGCTANSNKGNGIQSSIGPIKLCTASYNAQNGFVGSQRSVISECVANANTASGYRVNYVSTVKDCIAAQNSDSGIVADSGGGCDIRGNTCEENGNNSTAAGSGIRILGSFTRVEDNHVYVNWKGIEVAGVVGVYVVRNAAAANNTNFVIASGNKVGTIVSAPASGAISGSSGGAGAGSTDPFANVCY